LYLQAFDWVYFVFGIDCGEFDGSTSGCGSSWLLHQVCLFVEIPFILILLILPHIYRQINDYFIKFGLKKVVIYFLLTREVGQLSN
jgi:hypothetical protein